MHIPYCALKGIEKFVFVFYDSHECGDAYLTEEYIDDGNSYGNGDVGTGFSGDGWLYAGAEIAFENMSFVDFEDQ